ncbi:MAG: hypothetical protein AABY50_00260 [Nitrospirota bacterium]
MKRARYFLLSLIFMLFFYSAGYAQNKIEVSKLNQIKSVSQMQYILLQLNIGLLYATQDMNGVKALGVEYDQISNKFLIHVKVKKGLFHNLSIEQKKKFVHDIVGQIILPFTQFFYDPVAQILQTPAKNYGDILNTYTFRFKKWYISGGYEPLPFPEKHENESNESHLKRIEKWQSDSEAFSLLATDENGEISLFK